VSTSSCYNNKILEISCELLGTASTYPKYHEYYFLNDQILLFHAPAVQISNMQKKINKTKKYRNIVKELKIILNFEIEM
jgi:hypothetical protein